MPCTGWRQTHQVPMAMFDEFCDNTKHRNLKMSTRKARHGQEPTPLNRRQLKPPLHCTKSVKVGRRKGLGMRRKMLTQGILRMMSTTT